jgi:tRNA-2-methylthio-N6-dimethylallyladenosine synthase
VAFYKYRDVVPEEEKQRRLEILLTLQKQITDEENRKRVGATVEVLVEGLARQKGLLMGKTRDNRTVVFEGSPELIGELVKVRITDGSVAGLVGGTSPPAPSPIRGQGSPMTSPVPSPARRGPG